jgi:glyceraldehyde-3-phosphate dehydrogenase/erythrose-4-phosphate dehydrogenase
MTIKVAINGYGRIGRNVLRAFYEGGKKQDIQIVAINDLGNAESNAHLTRYDTAHGKFPGTVTVEGDNMIVNGDRSACSRSATRPKSHGASWAWTWCWSAPASSPPRKRHRPT